MFVPDCFLTVTSKFLQERRSATSVLHSNVLKTNVNVLIGCIGDSKFRFSSHALYNAVTYIGRRLLSFIASHLDEFAQELEPVTMLGLYSSHQPSLFSPAGNVINLNTDGITFSQKSDDDPNRLVESINSFCRQLTGTDLLHMNVAFRGRIVVESAGGTHHRGNRPRLWKGPKLNDKKITALEQCVETNSISGLK